MEVAPDKRGICRVGLLNERLKLALEISYPAKAMPRMANWQHYGPRGSYVTGLEPFFGSLLGKARDKDPRAEQYLQPGESRRYMLKLRVLSDRAALRQLAAFDGPVTNQTG